MKLTKIALTTSLIAAASFANASGIEFGLQASNGFGGDTLATSTSGDELEAGSGSTFGVFGLIPISSGESFFTKLALTYSRDSLSASNGDIAFSHTNVDALALMRMNKLEIGAGITYHLSPTYDQDLTSGSLKIDADDALGFVVEANYDLPFEGFFDGLHVGLRYTNIEYSFEGITQKFDGSNVAITGGYTF